MLPIIRLTQQASPVVRLHIATPGQWVLYDESGGANNINRFKMLVMSTRQTLVHFDLYANSYIVARHGELTPWQKLVMLKLDGKNVADGLEVLGWLPHYRKLAIVQLTARSGVRALRNLTLGELYGIGSRPVVNSRTIFLPSPERLDLPVNMAALPNPADRMEIQSKFAAGLPV